MFPPRPRVTGDGWAARRKPSPAKGGAAHPKGRNEMEDLGAAQVATRRGGARG